MQIIDHSGEKIILGMKIIFFAILKVVTLGKIESFNEKYQSVKKEFEEEKYKI